MESALKTSDKSEEFVKLLSKDISLTNIKHNQDMVFLSVRSTESGISGAIKHLANVINELHKRYEVNGFLYQCGVVQLAGRDAIIDANGSTFPDKEWRFPAEPIFCVYSFARVMKNCEEARDWVRSISMGGHESEIGRITFGLMKW